jgi:hypothetical protein
VDGKLKDNLLLSIDFILVERQIMTKKELFDLLIGKKYIEKFSSNNWYDLCLFSIEQKVENILYKKMLADSILNEIPKPIQKILFLSYNYNMQKNKIYLSEFINLYKELINKVNIFIPYKGLFMIKYIYKDLGLRHMEDIDCLCDRSDSSNIIELLKEQEYSLKLINDSPFFQNFTKDSVESLLFEKFTKQNAFVSNIKLDLKFIHTLSEEEIHIIKTSNIYESQNLIEISFMLLCLDFYNDSYSSSLILSPENCTLIKYFDIFSFINKYPFETASILHCPILVNKYYINYVTQCINYFSSDKENKDL